MEMAAKMTAAQEYYVWVPWAAAILAIISYEKPLLNVKVILMIKTKTIAKGKCFGSPARQRDSLVPKHFPFSKYFC